jgi:hypothetical protein
MTSVTEKPAPGPAAKFPGLREEYRIAVALGRPGLFASGKTTPEERRELVRARCQELIIERRRGDWAAAFERAYGVPL